MKHLFFGALALAFTLTGCGSGDESQSVANKGDQLQSTAERMKDDPNASPEARRIAAGVLRQTEQQKQLDSFADGK
jgi:hypothetical protein